MPDLYTIGYGGAAQSALLQTLLFHDVQTLLDIRELPQSRKPGLSKTALVQAAADVGIDSAHVRAQAERCCLLCYEANAYLCHSWFVGERVVERSSGILTLVHLNVGDFGPPWQYPAVPATL